MSYCDGLFSAGAAPLLVCMLYRVFRLCAEGWGGFDSSILRWCARAHVEVSIHAGARLLGKAALQADLQTIACRPSGTGVRVASHKLWHVLLLTSSSKWCCSLMETILQSGAKGTWVDCWCASTEWCQTSRPGGSKQEAASHEAFCVSGFEGAVGMLEWKREWRLRAANLRVAIAPDVPHKPFQPIPWIVDAAPSPHSQKVAWT